MRLIHVFSLIGYFVLSGCMKSCPEPGLAIEMPWSFDSLDAVADRSLATFTLVNKGTCELSGSEWIIYFNQLSNRLSHPIEIITPGSGLNIETISGDYHKLFPDETFVPLASGEQRSVHVGYSGFVGRVSYSPVGAYLVDGENHIYAVLENNSFPGLNKKELLEPHLDEVQSRFIENSRISDIPVDQLSLIPTPVQFESTGRELILKSRIVINHTAELENEARQLKLQLQSVFSGQVILDNNNGHPQIRLMLDQSVEGAEAYRLEVTDTGVTITGSDPAGVFYAIQTLARLYPVSNHENPAEQLAIRGVKISDRPRFPYRGLHLDVSRNFHSLDHVKRVIDLAAYYKLNKFHITIANDEGWRLEIPGLPELTDVGGRRGHTVNERDMLYPAYGSGPYHDAAESSGTGYYTRNQFTELLRYARDKHIEIILEIDVPGHARAAIKAMESRRYTYAQAGDDAKANEFLLHDPDDQSKYNTAQNYNDNIVCVCQESTYRFLEKVIEEVVRMYREADAPITSIHGGGDEVPYGAWQMSPVCAAWISDKQEIESTEHLQPYFLKRLLAIVGKHGLTTAGWEEIAMRTTEDGHNTTEINFDFADDNMLLYVWNSVWGWGREDVAYRLANGDYKVVMSNSSALYFDLAYNRDPAEPGAMWAGYVDTRKAFEFEPYDMFTTATTDAAGVPLDPDYVAGKIRLNTSASKNILGIQGQLYSETVRDSDNLDYYYFPKLLGLAERAWSKAPEWTIPGKRSDRLEAMNSAWGFFANTVGKVELPRLDHINGGVAYRIPMPGASYENGHLKANTRYPGLEIRYTSDGTNPMTTSSIYEGPIRLITEEVRLRAFNSIDRGGRTSIVRKLRKPESHSMQSLPEGNQHDRY
jgi:hexosaminidase